MIAIFTKLKSQTEKISSITSDTHKRQFKLVFCHIIVSKFNLISKKNKNLINRNSVRFEKKIGKFKSAIQISSSETAIYFIRKIQYAKKDNRETAFVSFYTSDFPGKQTETVEISSEANSFKRMNTRN